LENHFSINTGLLLKIILALIDIVKLLSHFHSLKAKHSCTEAVVSGDFSRVHPRMKRWFSFGAAPDIELLARPAAAIRHRTMKQKGESWQAMRFSR
jgi:hypothetical protein